MNTRLDILQCSFSIPISLSFHLFSMSQTHPLLSLHSWFASFSLTLFFKSISLNLFVCPCINYTNTSSSYLNLKSPTNNKTLWMIQFRLQRELRRDDEPDDWPHYRPQLRRLLHLLHGQHGLCQVAGHLVTVLPTAYKSYSFKKAWQFSTLKISYRTCEMIKLFRTVV